MFAFRRAPFLLPSLASRFALAGTEACSRRSTCGRALQHEAHDRHAPGIDVVLGNYVSDHVSASHARGIIGWEIGLGEFSRRNRCWVASGVGRETCSHSSPSTTHAPTLFGLRDHDVPP